MRILQPPSGGKSFDDLVRSLKDSVGGPRPPSPEGLHDLQRFLEEFWDDRLAVLKEAAEKDERPAISAAGGDPGPDPWAMGGEQ